MTAAIATNAVGTGGPDRTTAWPNRGLDAACAAEPRPRRAVLVVAVLLLGSFLGPSGMTLKLGLTLSTLKAALFVLFVVAAIELGLRITRGRYVFVTSDALVVALAAWMELALFVSAGSAGLASPLAVRPVEFLSAYTIGRCFFGSRETLALFAAVLVAVVAVMLAYGILDFYAGKNVFEVASAGASKVLTNNLATAYRFGLPRARGPLEHPILYGLFFSISATIFYFALDDLRLKIVGVGLCLAGTFAALSSAPMLSLGIFLGCVVYDWAFSNLRWRWTATAGLLGFGVAALLVVFEDPVHQLIKAFTLDPTTGIYRLLIWKWVAYNLETAPVFGIGTADWVRLQNMIPSIDALWLNQALQAGYGGLALLVAMLIGPFVVMTRRSRRSSESPREAAARRGVTIAIFQMAFLAFTVHFWGSCWALFALLLGIRAGFSEARYLPDVVRRRPVERPRMARGALIRQPRFASVPVRGRLHG